ncbi:MAG TPA: DMT family transporter [Bacteroidota bacterium]|nr:DMT family transporter [Bacteroidota bacterium]
MASTSLKLESIHALLKATFAVVVWGASFIATKLALEEVAPMTIIWLRFGIGVVILGLFGITRKELSMVSLREFGYLAGLGFVGITFHQWLQANGLVTAQATTTAWIVSTTPIFIALLGWVFLKEKLGGIAIGGIALATLGVLLVVSKGDMNAVWRGGFGTHGDVLVLISAPNWAVFSILSRRGLRTFSATNMMFHVMTLGWFFTGLLVWAGDGLSDMHTVSLQGWTSIAFLGIFCSGLAYIFWYDALKAIPASRVGVLLYLEPLVAVGVAAALLHEVVTIPVLFGGAAILLGVWLVHRP